MTHQQLGYLIVGLSFFFSVVGGVLTAVLVYKATRPLFSQEEIDEILRKQEEHTKKLEEQQHRTTRH